MPQSESLTELRIQKKMAQDAILDLIIAYEERFGIEVKDVQLVRVESNLGFAKKLVKVNLEIKINV